ncbi:type II toxin-antitoxin system YafQ family toxin [Delftia sp. WSY_22]|uniref:type II toxin-antitoxin system YafQ family toxin n=1 Tax=Delftia sp. WSY_22 TaxID=3367213 RepID=UPI00370A2526
MTSKKGAPSNKSAETKRGLNLPRIADYSQDFLKDYRKAVHSGMVDMSRVNEAITVVIANDGPINPEWNDHALKGSMDGYRELHVKGDLLLIYEVGEGPKKNTETVVFVRLGTHSELF